MSALAALLAFAAFVGVVLVLIVLAKRRLGHGVAGRLGDIDEGRRCPACNATDVEREGEAVRCRACGTITDLAAMRARQFDAHTIADIRELPRGGRDGPR